MVPTTKKCENKNNLIFSLRPGLGWKRLEEPAVILDFIHCTRLEPYQTSTMKFFAKTTKITVLHGCFSDFLN